jgi:hypothetical protein
MKTIIPKDRHCDALYLPDGIPEFNKAFPQTGPLTPQEKQERLYWLNLSIQKHKYIDMEIVPVLDKINQLKACCTAAGCIHQGYLKIRLNHDRTRLENFLMKHLEDSIKINIRAYNDPYLYTLVVHVQADGPAYDILDHIADTILKYYNT